VVKNTLKVLEQYRIFMWYKTQHLTSAHCTHTVTHYLISTSEYK